MAQPGIYRQIYRLQSRVGQETSRVNGTDRLRESTGEPAVREAA
jgi:hypothetical protein